MAERFVKLTEEAGRVIWTNGSIVIGASAGGACVTFAERQFYVRESPAEVLALLAGEGEGKAEGIEDVVAKLRFVRDDAALRKAAAAATEITLVMRFDQLDRLVAYFDGRKTDA